MIRYIFMKREGAEAQNLFRFAGDFLERGTCPAVLREDFFWRKKLSGVHGVIFSLFLAIFKMQKLLFCSKRRIIKESIKKPNLDSVPNSAFCP